eukprot:jgi/Mesen1/7308/ME000374S06669
MASILSHSLLPTSVARKTVKGTSGSVKPRAVLPARTVSMHTAINLKTLVKSQPGLYNSFRNGSAQVGKQWLPLIDLTASQPGGLRVGCPRATAADSVNEAGEALQDYYDELSQTPEYNAWNGITEKLTISSSFVGLLMLVPQIVKNFESLLGGNVAAVGILSWQGYSTGFLGNMLLLSYFVSKKETSASLVQTIGASTTAVLLAQVFLAGYMPLPAFAAVAGLLGFGLAINLLQFKGGLPAPVWGIWQDITGVAGLAVLPQVVWSTFVPTVATPLPGVIAGVVGAVFVTLLRTGTLSEDMRDTWQKVSGWTATLLFMFMPVAQLQACFTKPESLAGISVLSPVLAMVANGLMVPRALFTRDLMWFTGAAWGMLLMGWGIMLSMYLNDAMSKPLFYALSAALVGYLGTICSRDAKAHSLASPLASLHSLVFGKRAS